MLPRHLRLSALVASAFLLQGCFSSDNSPTAGADDDTADEAAIQSVMFEEEGTLTDPDVRYFDDGSGPPTAPINTHAWRRELLSLDRKVQITIEKPDGEPATADVVMTADAIGLLHLWACAENDLAHLTKDFNDSAIRSLFFRRVRPRLSADGDRHRGWKLQALSGVLIQSENTTRAIHSVRFQAGDVDVTVDNVTDLVPVEELLTLPAGSEALITVDTGDASDSVFLHLRHMKRRRELENNGDGTFSGRYIVGEHRGPRHVAVDVLAEGTLFDDVEPYDNIAWGIPYRIRGGVDDINGGGGA